MKITRLRPVVVVGLVILLILGSTIGLVALTSPTITDNGDGTSTFSSCFDLTNYISENRSYYGGYPAPLSDSITSNSKEIAESSGAGSSDYSTTNIQVEGVDESDIVKNDGNSLFVFASENKYIDVFDLTDPSNPKKASEIELEFYGQSMYLVNETLVVISSEYSYQPLKVSANFWNQYSIAQIFDVSNLESPQLESTYYLDGYYVNSRLTDNTLYLISSANVGEIDLLSGVEGNIPRISIADGLSENLQTKRASECSEVTPMGDSAYSFLTVAAIPLDGSEFSSRVILGDSSNMYVSRNNIYLTTQVLPYENAANPDIPIPVPSYDWEPKTEIFKISMDGTKIYFKAKGQVDGTVLNQFSMDEYYGYFRIATTKGTTTRDFSSSLYVFDEQMNLTGQVNGLGKTEQIYSVRFMGEKAYVVTFKQTDPLYVLDLVDPSNPKVAGELKIPGFSRYLHPFDSNHLIGVGNDADENTGTTSGVKVTLFDVTDIADPKVKSELIFGGRLSDTPVSWDHKAFLFDKQKELLVLPVNIYNESEAYYYQPDFEGFIVMSANLAEGLVEKKRIDFSEDTSYYSNTPRSLYIGDYLYLIFNNEIKVVDLKNYSVVKEISAFV